MIEELYPRFLDCGYSPLLFWQLSTAEVVDMLESYHRQQDFKQQQERARLRDIATVLDGFGTILLNNLLLREGEKSIRMRDVFPDLYHTDTSSASSQAAQSQAADMEVYMAQRLHHAYCFNKNRRQNRQSLEGKDQGHGRDHVRDT